MAQIRNPKKSEDPLAGDLSELLRSAGWKKTRFIFAPKDTTVTLRLPASLVNGAKKVAKRKGVKYQAMMREAIADFLVKEGE
jgi:predicted DNA binding CopG/RHH family protein